MLQSSLLEVANDMENKERVLQTRARQAEARGQSRGSVPLSTPTTTADDGLGAASRGEPGRRTGGGDGDAPGPTQHEESGTHRDRRAQPALGGHREGVSSLRREGLGVPVTAPRMQRAAARTRTATEKTRSSRYKLH